VDDRVESAPRDGAGDRWRTALVGWAQAVGVPGVVLVVLPMVIASAMAMLVATRLADPPIYDSLRERLLRPGG
jgi:hypothetical protein